MTNSRRGDDKHQRLVTAAAELLHSQGVQKTTLADIATAAGIPLGNVYYYFKTRDALVQAVIERHHDEIRSALASLDGRRTPKARLKGLAELWADSADVVARSGCPLGGLSYELNKCHDELAERSRTLLGTVLDWAEAQFAQMGLRDPRGLAVQYVAGVQGAALLSNVFGDAPLLKAEVRRLERWVDSLG